MIWGTTLLSLAVTDLAKVALTLDLEVQGDHACRNSTRPPVAETCSNRT